MVGEELGCFTISVLFISFRNAHGAIQELNSAVSVKYEVLGIMVLMVDVITVALDGYWTL